MKRIQVFLFTVLCAGTLVSTALAQGDAARAAAEKDAAEERFKLLNSAVEALLTSNAQQDTRISELREEIKRLRADNSKTDTGQFVTREELRKLAESIQELDQKRQADRKLILEEFEALKTDLRKMLNAPPSARIETRENPTPPTSPDKNAEANPAQEGVWYVVEPNNTVSAIVVAHREAFKAQGKTTSIALVEQANPGIDVKKILPGRKIFIPLVPR